MSKDAFYFPHDSNAKDDPKCIMLIEQLGLEGYGIYWVLVETLRDQPNYKYPLKLVPALARRFNTTADKMNIVIQGYDLFTIDEQEFFSESLLRRMLLVEAKREQARNAINARWNRVKELPTPKENTEEIRTYNESNSDEIQVKESKVKKRKEKEINKNTYNDCVKLTDEEYKKLIEKFGEKNTNEKIENLALYIKSKNKKYHCHYSTILSWERKNNNSNEPVNPYRRA